MGDAESGWAVWRADDNGNTFIVRKHLNRTEAERLVVEFTARGHKQIYWAQQQGMDPGAERSAGEPRA